MRSAPQKQPMPTTSDSKPSGNGGVIGVPSTSCRSGTGIAASRPGSASSGATSSDVWRWNRNIRSVLLVLESGGVDAIAQAGRVRAVGEHVAEVAAAAGTQHLGALHEEAAVGLLVDRLFGGGRRESGPAAARVVLGVGGEELRAAAGAHVRARLERVVVLAG